MKNKLPGFFLWALLGLCSLAAMAGQSADQDDIYLMGWIGTRSGQGAHFGGGAGYVFTEGFGLGALYEQTGSQPYAAAELRWFLEPFESAFAFGVEKAQNSNSMSPMATLAGDYLFSLTPSLALRASVKWFLPLESASSVFTGFGVRALF